MVFSWDKEIFEKKIKKINNNNDLIPWTYNSLNEAERIASIVKKRIIKD